MTCGRRISADSAGDSVSDTNAEIRVADEIVSVLARFGFLRLSRSRVAHPNLQEEVFDFGVALDVLRVSCIGGGADKLHLAALESVCHQG